MDPLPCKTQPSRRRSDSTRLGRLRYIMIGRDNDPVPDRKAWPRWDRSPTSTEDTPDLRSLLFLDRYGQDQLGTTDWGHPLGEGSGIRRSR